MHFYLSSVIVGFVCFVLSNCAATRVGHPNEDSSQGEISGVGSEKDHGIINIPGVVFLDSDKRVILYHDPAQPGCFYATTTTWTESKNLSENQLYQMARSINSKPYSGEIANADTKVGNHFILRNLYLNLVGQRSESDIKYIYSDPSWTLKIFEEFKNRIYQYPASGTSYCKARN